MTRNEFQILLHNAANSAVDFARRFVHNEFPKEIRFHVLLNQSCDIHATPDEKLYPEDDGREFECITEDQVIDLLFRDGRCPEWIDILVEAQSLIDTRLSLTCCGRFTNDPRRMYYTARGTGPFGIKSPWLPPGYREGEKFWVPLIEE